MVDVDFFDDLEIALQEVMPLSSRLLDAVPLCWDDLPASTNHSATKPAHSLEATGIPDRRVNGKGIPLSDLHQAKSTSGESDYSGLSPMSMSASSPCTAAEEAPAAVDTVTKDQETPKGQHSTTCSQREDDPQAAPSAKKNKRRQRTAAKQQAKGRLDQGHT